MNRNIPQCITVCLCYRCQCLNLVILVTNELLFRLNQGSMVLSENLGEIHKLLACPFSTMARSQFQDSGKYLIGSVF